MKSTILYILVIAILGFSIYNAVDDTNEMHQHENFFEEVREFMKPGGRNTAKMGYEMCLVQNSHADALRKPKRDCCSIYFPDDKSFCEKLK